MDLGVNLDFLIGSVIGDQDSILGVGTDIRGNHTARKGNGPRLPFPMSIIAERLPT